MDCYSLRIGAVRLLKIKHPLHSYIQIAQRASERRPMASKYDKVSVEINWNQGLVIGDWLTDAGALPTLHPTGLRSGVEAEEDSDQGGAPDINCVSWPVDMFGICFGLRREVGPLRCRMRDRPPYKVVSRPAAFFSG